MDFATSKIENCSASVDEVMTPFILFEFITNMFSPNLIIEQ